MCSKKGPVTKIARFAPERKGRSSLKLGKITGRSLPEKGSSRKEEPITTSTKKEKREHSWDLKGEAGVFEERKKMYARGQ